MTVAVTFVLAFVLTGVILDVLSLRSPQLQETQRGKPENVNASDSAQPTNGDVLLSPNSGNRSYEAASSPPVDAVGEVVPPMGANHMLNASEINYCLSERVRLDAMRPLLNKKSEVQLREFNLRSNDFKLRCTRVQYQQSDMQRVKQLVEDKKNSLRRDAVSTMSHWR
jgi:hypothetical protein